MGTAPFLYNPRKIPNSLIKLRARVRTLTDAIKISHGKREPRNIFRQWSQTPKCDPKKNRFWYFLAQWETFLDRILAFDSTGESCASDRVPTANCSQIPYRSAPSLAILLTVSPPRQQRQRAARATAAFLNRFGCKPTDGRCVFKCKCVRI